VVVAVVVALVLSGGSDEDAAKRTRTPRSVLPAFVEPEKRALKKTFERAARESDVPVALLEGLAWRESRWRAEAFNPESGAIGIGQLLPETATYVATELLREPDLNPYIAVDNIRLTARYLRVLLDGFPDDETLAIASYLQGSTSVRNEGVDPSTAEFVAEVQAIRKRFEAARRGKRGSARDPLND
jgi:soluble lytic murein transglycosylase-like protein